MVGGWVDGGWMGGWWVDGGWMGGWWVDGWMDVGFGNMCMFFLSTHSHLHVECTLIEDNSLHSKLPSFCFFLLQNWRRTQP